MMWRLFVAGVLAFSLVGCGKGNKPVEAAAPPPSADASAAVPPGPPPMNPTAVPVTATATNASGGTDYSELNRDVRRWLLRNRRPPKDFAEYAATATIQIPPPPAGKKYALDKHLHILLINP
jgi:hypothetical protein